MRSRYARVDDGVERIAAGSAHTAQADVDARRPAPDVAEYRSDVARVQRLGSRFTGAALLVYCLVSMPALAQNASLTAGWWLPVSIALVVVPSGALFVLGFRRDTRWVLPAALASSAGYLLATALWFVAWNGEISEGALGWPVWLVQFPGVPALALVVALRFRLAWAHLIVATVLVRTANHLGLYGEPAVSMLLSALLTIGLTGLFVAIAMAMATTAQTLDRTREEAIAAVVSSASETAREAERARYDALIHDRVISCLLAMRAGSPERRLVDNARDALAEMDAWQRGEVGSVRPVPAVELRGRLRYAATRIDEAVDLGVELAAETEPAAGVPEPDGVAYPPEVADAVVDAMSEALRNSVRHAGPDVDRAVVGELARSDLWIAVIDDGAGFDPAAVDGRRYGIEEGIRGRMNALAGGGVELRSEIGRGTMVRLSWTRR